MSIISIVGFIIWLIFTVWWLFSFIHIGKEWKLKREPLGKTSDSKEFNIVDEIEGDDNHLRLNFKKKQAKLSEESKEKLLKMNRFIDNDREVE